MKARPILFSAPMVRALLEGRKTQTRRIIKPQPAHGCFYTINESQNAALHMARGESGYAIYVPPKANSKDHRLTCPYGEPGDLLWVRETWAPSSEPENHAHARVGFTYRSDWDRADDTELRNFRWKPSLHMPRVASRLTLELTGLRVERLQDISEADAIAEGCFFTDYGRRCFHEGQGDIATCPAPEAHHMRNPGWMWDKTVSHDQCLGSARFAYGNLWESINGPGSWDANPWVWVLNFRIHQANVDSLLKARAA